MTKFGTEKEWLQKTLVDPRGSTIADENVIVAGSLKVTGASNEPSSDPNDPEIVITPNGSGGFTVQLRADRLGGGNGRIYRFFNNTPEVLLLGEEPKSTDCRLPQSTNAVSPTLNTC